MNISIIGGDLRIAKLAEMYSNDKEDINIFTYGLEKYFEKDTNKIKECDNIDEAIQASDIIISGMPFTRDNSTVNAPFAENQIEITNVKKLVSGKTFIAGGIPSEFYLDGNINSIDLMQNEELTILNAIPTVEGTIKIAIEEREETIHESNVLICGFGRIGKILCDKFSALGANVYCSARKESDLAWIREKRYIPLKYDEITKFSSNFDIVINTVPTMVIKKEQLDSFNKEITIIDVASNPGGIDKEYAKEKGIKVITALGIPGKEMPKTAAKYIKNVVDKMIK